MSHGFRLGAARTMTKYERLAYTPTISDRSVMSYFHYRLVKMLMIVLKCDDFFCEIACKTSVRPVENLKENVA